MPEIKNQFTGGKMNKDLDERLVPKGEYRDAMNIQVSTSEGSGVGTVQNILGNTPGCTYDLPEVNPIPQGAFTVGSVSDEKNDTLYWFVSGQNYNSSEIITNNNWDTSDNNYVSMKDFIFRKTSEKCEPVFVDKYAFSTANTSSENSNVLSNIPIEVFNEIQAGWTAQGVTDGGQTSNITTIASVSDQYVSFAEWESTPQSSNTTSSFFIGNTYNPMVTLGSKVYIPLVSQTTTSAYEQYLSNVIYIQDFNGSPSSIVGSTITILPDHNSPQTRQITDCYSSSISISESSGNTYYISVVTVELDAPLDYFIEQDGTTFSINQAAFTYGNGISSSTPPVASSYNNLVINAEITSTSTTSTNIATGELTFNPADINITATYPVIGSEVIMNDQTYFVQTTNVANNSITLEDASGNIIDGWQVGGFLNGLPQQTGGPIIFPQDLQVYFENNLDLSADNYTSVLFKGPRVLNFNHNEYITGINIIDDMLFWTDGKTEPKKINIPRSVEGTLNDATLHTRLINQDTNVNYNSAVLVKEEHITVIKNNPKNPLQVDIKTERDDSKNYSGVIDTTDDPGTGINLSSIISSNNTAVNFNFNDLAVDDIVKIKIPLDTQGSDEFTLDWSVGRYLLFKEFDIDINGQQTLPQIPLTSFSIRAVITNWAGNIFISDNTNSAEVEIRVLALNNVPITPNDGLKFAVDLELEEEPIFKDKFPRFSYRYKYEDGEYSTFAPWSEVAFKPGSFNYDPKEGYNIGMINNATSIVIKNFTPKKYSGLDVVGVDLLYKEESSPNVYIVETVSPIDIPVNGANNTWDLDAYEIKSESIKSVVAANQMLRPWDNVPKKALAQEVTGNRLVYGNYEQNFDVKIGTKKYKPSFKNYLSTNTNSQAGAAERSIKSLRDYKLGVVFTDNYGRETPILISESGGFKVDKINSSTSNKLVVGLKGVAPEEISYFKFYIKETSTEYYNLAMDRWYAAEDGNIWIAFPSSERNKVDIDTTLFLKKGDSEAIKNNSKYKILALENEAPEYIKTRKIRLGSVTHDSSRLVSGNNTYGTVFGVGLATAPRYNSISFEMGYDEGNFAATSMSSLEDITDDLYIKFTGNGGKSSEYKVSKITSDLKANDFAGGSKYYVTLDRPLEENDIDFIFDSPSTPTKILDGTSIQISRASVENSPKFAGRFFAKIANDGRIKLDTADDSVYVDYIESGKKTVYLLDNDDTLLTRSSQAWLNPVSNTGSGNNFFTTFPDNWINADYENHLNHSVQGTTTWNKHNARQAFFGQTKHNTYYNPNASWDAVEFPNPVWFINRSDQKYSQSYSGPNPNQLYWVGGDANMSDSYWNANTGIGGGISHGSSYSVMNIAVGGYGYKNYQDDWGLYKKLELDTTDTNGQGVYKGLIKTFHGIGDDNDNYNDTETKEFVKRINSSYKFKWAEDPTNTIYTIQNTSRTKWGRWDRFATDALGEDTSELRLKRKMLVGSPASYHKNWNAPLTPSMSHWDPAGAIGESMVDGLKIGSVIYEPSVTSNTGTQIVIAAANPNIKVGMSVAGTNVVSGTVITSISGSGTTITVSTALGSLATAGSSDIEIGYTIRVVSSDVAAPDTYIVVDNEHAECEKNSGRYRLEKGMMLKSYNNGGATATNAIIKKVEQVSTGYKITLTGYSKPLVPSLTNIEGGLGTYPFTIGDKVVFEQVSMNSISDNTEYNSDLWKSDWQQIDGKDHSGVGAVGYTMVMLEPIDEYDDGGILPPDPYVWETEPKEDTDLDIYYEISENNPLELNQNTIQTAIPIGSTVVPENGFRGFAQLEVIDNSSADGGGNTIIVNANASLDPSFSTLNGDTINPLVSGDRLTITRPSGVTFEVTIEEVVSPSRFKLNRSLYNIDYSLNWFNCYSFGNGVESNRVRDNFNLPFIANGVKASTTYSEEYKKEQRKYGLIYSGLYNSNSGVNNLNQFIQAEKITKDINPIYGSIQKLYSGWGQGGDLIALCEDRTIKILANKDALYNADGNTNVTSTNNVLGQAIPYAGEYGISTNPESFASESYRAYFTDKVRGAVMRLSIDGLTPISDHGMKDYFRDNLKLNVQLVGSYDDKKEEYNITLKQTTSQAPKTVSFKENVRGWVSFKSFIPEDAVSCTNDYYTFKEGRLWRHHDETPNTRNMFYGSFNSTDFSTINVILNDAPSVIKTFHTLNYEGSKSKVDLLTNYTNSNGDNVYTTSYNNLQNEQGWSVQTINTDQEEGSLSEFIEKEGKWFNYIHGKTGSVTDNGSITGGFDNADFSFQGIGSHSNLLYGNSPGCTDQLYTEYDSTATIDDGSCVNLVVEGCTDPNATNYDVTASANTDDGSCLYYGCMDPSANNYSSNYNYDDGSCVYPVFGCIDSTAFNYDSTADTDDGSCYPVIMGCLSNPLAPNFATLTNNVQVDVNTDDGSCLPTPVYGCTDSIACNYDPLANTDDGSCGYCGVASALNYNSNVTCSDNSECLFATPITNLIANQTDTTVELSWIAPTGPHGAYGGQTGVLQNYTIYYNNTSITLANNITTYIISGLQQNTNYTFTVNSNFNNYNGSLQFQQESVSVTTLITQVNGCTDPLAFNYDANANADDGSCIAVALGCIDTTAYNYDPLANTDNGTCIASVLGCTDATQSNYDPLANVDDGTCIAHVYGCTDNSLANDNSTVAATNFDINATAPCNTNYENDCCQYIMPTLYTPQDINGNPSYFNSNSETMNVPGWRASNEWSGGVRKTWAQWNIALSPKIDFNNTKFSYQNDNGFWDAYYQGNIETFLTPTAIGYGTSPTQRQSTPPNSIEWVDFSAGSGNVSGKVFYGPSYIQNQTGLYPPNGGSGSHKQAVDFVFENTSIPNHITPYEEHVVVLGCNDPNAWAGYNGEISFYDNNLCEYSGSIQNFSSLIPVSTQIIGGWYDGYYDITHVLNWNYVPPANNTTNPDSYRFQLGSTTGDNVQSASFINNNIVYDETVVYDNSNSQSGTINEIYSNPPSGNWNHYRVRWEKTVDNILQVGPWVDYWTQTP